MAHHVADLITRCEAEDREDKESAQKECFDAILTLWRHRSELPNGKRPFEDLEPIVRAVASLDPEDETPRYFRQARPPKGATDEESEAESWLKLVEGFDYSAKLLIGFCLAQAAESAVDKSKEWVEHAKAAGLDDGPSEIVIRLVAPDDELSKEPDHNAKLREQIEGRIRRLKGFVKMADALANDLQAQLESLSNDIEGACDPKQQS